MDIDLAKESQDLLWQLIHGPQQYMGLIGENWRFTSSSPYQPIGSKAIKLRRFPDELLKSGCIQPTTKDRRVYEVSPAGREFAETLRPPAKA